MSDRLSVQQKLGPLREKPSFLSRILTQLAYADQVQLLNEKGDWLEVKFQSSVGWMHRSSLSTKEIVLNSTNGDVNKSVSDDELVLAGKGFSEEVEKGYRQHNPHLSFNLVDTMEKQTTSPTALRTFLIEGGLTYE
jgi:uncharacterized protein YgiM (DUF1202 family)